MKKLLFTLLLSIFLIPCVNAEQAITLSPYNKDIYENANITSLDYIGGDSYSCNSYSSCYEKAIELFNNSDNQYYYIRLNFSNLDSSGSSWQAYMYLYTFNFSSTDTYTTTIQLSPSRYYFTINNENYLVNQGTSGTGGLKNSFYELYDTNFPFRASSDVTFLNFYSESANITINSGEYLPKIKDLVKYDSYEDYKSVFDNYTEVNLNSYEYVILSLRDYSLKEPFDTNLLVKGMIGITPVYEFGTVEKEFVTDRCNVSYSDYTDYRFFILKNDLLNNAFYYVKACEDDSLFKFDNTVFNITYITTENVDDPVVTFGGVDYHTIPFNNLSNSANQNEQNNFIPGESGSSLTDIIDNVSDFTSDIWNAISSFMGLVTKFFNTLPEEFRYLSITSFTVLTVLAMIKFIRG